MTECIAEQRRDAIRRIRSENSRKVTLVEQPEVESLTVSFEVNEDQDNLKSLVQLYQSFNRSRGFTLGTDDPLFSTMIEVQKGVFKSYTYIRQNIEYSVLRNMLAVSKLIDPEAIALDELLKMPLAIKAAICAVFPGCPEINSNVSEEIQHQTLNDFIESRQCYFCEKMVYTRHVHEAAFVTIPDEVDESFDDF